MQDPFAELMDEHRVIERVLEALETATDQVGAEFYARALDFITQFADGAHHEKEEQHVFPALEACGIPREHGPLGVMLEEHEQGRRHVSAMRDLLAAGDLDGLRQESLAYAAVMRGHIEKEDKVLFPMGQSVLGPQQLDEVRAGFDAMAPASDRAAWEALADSLQRGVEAPR